MKRFYFFLLLCLLAGLVACGGGGDTATPAAEATAPSGEATSANDTTGQPATVTFLISGSPEEEAVYQQVVDAFQATQSNITMDLQNVPGDDFDQRLATSFAGGSPADVILINYRKVARFANGGAFESLTPYVSKSNHLTLTDFYPQALQAFTINSQLYCIPQNISSLVVYYNQDLFDKAGLAYPQAGWTWEDFVTTAHALTQDTDGDGVIDQYGAGIEASVPRLAPFIWQKGGTLVDDEANPTRLTIDSPEAMAAIEWFVGLQTTEKVVPDATAEAAQGSEDRFLNGTMGMYFNSRKSVPTMRTITSFKWNVAGLPQADQPATVLHSDGFCMSSSSTVKDAAWAFIEFANGLNGQTILAKGGRTVPSMRGVAQSDSFLDAANPPANSQLFLDVIPTIHVLPIMDNWTSIESTVDKELERAFYGQATVEEAVQTAVEQSAPLFAKP